MTPRATSLAKDSSADKIMSYFSIITDPTVHSTKSLAMSMTPSLPRRVPGGPESIEALGRGTLGKEASSKRSTGMGKVREDVLLKNALLLL